MLSKLAEYFDKKDFLLLSLVILIALFLALQGFLWGLNIDSNTHFFNGDEGSSVTYSKLYFIEHIHSEQWYHVKGLVTSIGFAGVLLSFFKEVNLTDLLLIGRGISLFYFIATVVLIYLFCRIVKDRYLAFFAALSFAVFDLSLIFSNMATADAAGVFWFFLSIVLIYFASFKRNEFLDLGAIIAATLALNTKFLFTPLLFLALVFLLRKENLSKKIYSLTIFILVFVSIFYLSSGTIATYTNIKNTVFTTVFYAGDVVEDNNPLISPILYILTIIAGTSLLSVIAAIFGAKYFIEDSNFPHKRNFLIYFILPVVLCFIAMHFTDSIFPRRMLFLYPILALFCGYFLSELYKKAVCGKRLFYGIALVIFIAYPFALSFHSQQLFANENRADAYEWVKENIPLGSRIQYSRYSDANYLEGYNFSGLNAEADVDYIFLHQAYYGRYYKKLPSGFKVYPKCCSQVHHCVYEDCIYIQHLLKGETDYKIVKEFRIKHIFPERAIYKELFGEYYNQIGDVIIFGKSA